MFSGVEQVFIGLIAIGLALAPLYRTSVVRRRLREQIEASRRCSRCGHALHPTADRCAECGVPALADATDDARMQDLLRRELAVRARVQPWRVAVACAFAGLAAASASIPLLVAAGVALPTSLAGRICMDARHVITCIGADGSTIRLRCTVSWLQPFVPPPPSPTGPAAIGDPWQLDLSDFTIVPSAGQASGTEPVQGYFQFFRIEREPPRAFDWRPFRWPTWELMVPVGSGNAFERTALPDGPAAVDAVEAALATASQWDAQPVAGQPPRELPFPASDRRTIAAALVAALDQPPSKAPTLFSGQVWFASMPFSALVILSALADLFLGVVVVWMLRRDVRMPASEWSGIARALEARHIGWTLSAARWLAK
jgi:hypothetical protein